MPAAVSGAGCNCAFLSPLLKAAGSHRLRALHRIERLFLQLLEVEEMQRKMSLATEEQEHKTQEVGRIYQALNIRACSSEEEAEDEFLQVLCVRKGKKLTARLLPHLAPEQAEKILLTITHHLPFLMKKDAPDEASTSSLGQGGAGLLSSISFPGAGCLAGYQQGWVDGWVDMGRGL